MALEIERKFIVNTDLWQPGDLAGSPIRQGYIAANDSTSVRVRVAKGRARLTIKASVSAITRQEFEYDIPVADGEELLKICLGSIITKTRYRVPFADHIWEIDRFHGDNDGLVLAEIELDDAAATFSRPPWLGVEVSDDPRYYNAALAQNPYCRWRGQLRS
jgi:adenylate cyclase